MDGPAETTWQAERMPRNWLSIKVELLRGRGRDFWPPPGRRLVVGPRHTFEDLALGINQALARWDLAHLSKFELADGSEVTDSETIDEGDSLFNTATASYDLSTTKVTELVGPGDTFRYVFDFGDDWTHACTVDDKKVDPLEVYGAVPDTPAAYWGWGEIPDQYGRGWAEDDGESAPPPRPQGGHPMLSGTWPDAPRPPVDRAELRGATYRRDIEAILAAVVGHDADPLLQHVGSALEIALQGARGPAWALAAEVSFMLRQRDWPGDAELADDLAHLLREQPLEGTALPVALDEVADQLEGPPDQEGGYLDLQTGEVLPGFMADEAEVGEDAAIDLEEDPDRWLYLPREGSRDGWSDMALFAEAVTDPHLRDRLTRDLEGRGAFRRFKDSIYDVGMQEEWFSFSDERKAGRAREFLAGHGIRALPPTMPG